MYHQVIRLPDIQEPIAVWLSDVDSLAKTHWDLDMPKIIMMWRVYQYVNVEVYRHYLLDSNDQYIKMKKLLAIKIASRTVIDWGSWFCENYKYPARHYPITANEPNIGSGKSQCIFGFNDFNEAMMFKLTYL
jgi:hypothetical protein